MLPDRVSNPGPLTYESGALPIALRGPATHNDKTSLEKNTGSLLFHVHSVYSRLSLPRNRQDPLKQFEISVLRHIRFVVLRKKQFEFHK